MWQHPMDWGPRRHSKEKGSRPHIHCSLLPDWGCNVWSADWNLLWLPHSDGLCPWTMSQNQTLSSSFLETNKQTTTKTSPHTQINNNNNNNTKQNKKSKNPFNWVYFGMDHYVVFQVSVDTDIWVSFLRKFAKPGVVQNACHPSPWLAAQEGYGSAVSLGAHWQSMSKDKTEEFRRKMVAYPRKLQGQHANKHLTWSPSEFLIVTVFFILWIAIKLIGKL